MSGIASIVVVSFGSGALVGLVTTLVAIYTRRPLLTIPLTILVLGSLAAANLERVSTLLFNSMLG